MSTLGKYKKTNINAIVNNDKQIITFRQIERRASKALASIAKHWPQLDIDGVLNIWIVKPGNKCRGKGIQLMNNIKDIIGLLNIPAQKSRYVVQKYIGKIILIDLLKC